MLKNITNGAIMVATSEGNKSLNPNETIAKNLVLNAERLLQIKFVEHIDSEKEEAERLAKEKAEKLAKEEAERLAKEKAEKLAKEEAERLAKEEAERLAKEKAEKEEAERLAKEKAEKEEASKPKAPSKAK